MLEEVERNRKEGNVDGTTMSVMKWCDCWNVCVRIKVILLGSGGSGGWSDFGDDIVGEADDDKEKTPASSTITIPVAPVAGEVREVAKLRGQLKKVEQELETTRYVNDFTCLRIC